MSSKAAQENPLASFMQNYRDQVSLDEATPLAQVIKTELQDKAYRQLQIESIDLQRFIETLRRPPLKEVYHTPVLTQHQAEYLRSEQFKVEPPTRDMADEYGQYWSVSLPFGNHQQRL